MHQSEGLDKAETISSKELPERSKDWVNQARRDLNVAEKMMYAGSFEWSCFIAQQAAGKAVKAAFQKLHAVAWGYSVMDLLKALSDKVTVPEELYDCARSPGRYYVTGRYPNGFGSGSPYEYFSRKDAEDAIVCDRRIIEFCSGILA
ncbi:MAG: HEPN domain-containing protein [Methanomicrobiales archaeon]|nr:HEPN domain-containing protein [Methanomicrobiales archaeon]